jgi:hypothetical protein
MIGQCGGPGALSVRETYRKLIDHSCACTRCVRSRARLPVLLVPRMWRTRAAQFMHACVRACGVAADRSREREPETARGTVVATAAHVACPEGGEARRGVNPARLSPWSLVRAQGALDHHQ